MIKVLQYIVGALMRFINSLSVALVLGMGVSAPLSAQTLRSVGEPAEFPPASFTANQYVDSRGCVYIRAGISGNTTWVPRVARNRTAVCGFEPSLSQKVAETPKVDEAPKTKPVVAAKPAAKPAAPKVAKTVKPVAAEVKTAKGVAPKAKPAKVVAKAVAKPVAKAPAKIKRVVKATPKRAAPVKPVVAARKTATVLKPAPIATRVVKKRPEQSFFARLFGPRPLNTVASIKATPQKVAPTVAAPVPPAQTASGTSVCANASAFSQQYINSGKITPVRCGPQDGLPYTPGPTRTVVAKSKADMVKVAPAQNRVVSRKDTNGASVKVVRRVVAAQTPPKGYRPVWKDGRLNPKRAQGTAEGIAAMNLVWTQDLPRQLIDENSGRNVTGLFPKLKFPFLSMSAQNREMQTRISTKSVKAVTPKVVKRNVKVVAKSAPKKPAAAAKGRYVQIGTFGNAANVQKNVRRLKASGMPVRVANITSKGRKLQIVLAGPFQSSKRLGSALRALRGAGYNDAFIR